MKRREGWFIVALLCLSPGQAGAQGQPNAFQLQYRLGPGTASCPDEQEFREAVRAEVGRDPFAPGAPMAIVVEISRQKGSFTWGLRELDATGVQRWARAPLSRPGCPDLLDAMVLALKTQFFSSVPPPPRVTPAPPLISPQPPTTPTAAPGPAPEASAKPASPPAVAPPASRRPLVQIGNGAWALFGSTPTLATLGMSIDVGLRWPVASMTLEGRSSLPGRLDLPAASPRSRPGEDHFTVSMWTATLVPCLHYRIAAGCALAQIGELTSASTATARALQGAVGARLGVEIPLLSHIHGRIAADLLGTMRSITVCRPEDAAQGCAHGDTEAGSWSQPRVIGALGAGMIGVF